MQAKQLELKLIPVSKKLTSKGGYRGHIVDRGGMGYDEVIQEVIKNRYLSLSSDMVKMVVEAVFDTMITGIMQDGQTRRLGDYLSLQLEVRGGFDEPGDQFDPAKHKLAMVLRPLKEFRRVAGNKDVSVFNRNSGPKVVIEKMYSASCSEGGEIKFGEDLILEGENLFALEDGNDVYAFKYYSQFQTGAYCGGGSIMPEWVSDDGRKMVIPWRETIGPFIEQNMEKFNPSTNPPLAVMVGIRSRGGLETAKRQLHRGKAYFDTWLAKHPDYRGDFSKVIWGSI